MSEVLFEATPKQARFLQAVFSGKFKYLMYGGAIRSGKSYVGISAIFMLAKMFPGSRWAIVRKDLPTLVRNTIPTFGKLKPDGFCGEINRTRWEVDCANGSKIIFFPESIRDDPDLDRWKGLEVNGFLIEEANEISAKSWNKAIERAGSWTIKPPRRSKHLVTQPPPLILLTVNPAPGWVRQVFYDPWSQGRLYAPFYFEQALLSDNPYLTEEYKDSLKNLTELEYRRFVLGDWNTVEGAAFEELDRKIHIATPEEANAVVQRIKPFWHRWSSFDWGFGHPFAAGEFIRDEDDTIWMMDSVHGRGLVDSEIAARMTRSMHPKSLMECYADRKAFQQRKAHEGPMPTVADVFREFSIHCVRAADDRIPGWSSLRRGLSQRAPNPRTGKPMFRFFPTPGNDITFSCLQSMVLDPKRMDDVLKVDADPKYGTGGDDPADMTRYGVSTFIPASVGARSEMTEEDWFAKGMDPNRSIVPQIVDRHGYVPESIERTPTRLTDGLWAPPGDGVMLDSYGDGWG